MSKKILLSLLVAALVVGLLVVGFLVGKKNTPTEQEQVGSIPGTTITMGCTTIGGNTTCEKNLPIRKATSTFCMFPLPKATTSLEMFSVNITHSTGTPYYLVLEATGTPMRVAGMSTSTSPLFTILVPASKQGIFTFRATSSYVNYLDPTSAFTEDLTILPKFVRASSSTSDLVAPTLVLTARTSENSKVNAGNNQVATGTCSVRWREF